MSEAGVERVCEEARNAYQAGLWVRPAVEDGSKRPWTGGDGRWGKERLSPATLRTLYPGCASLGIETGHKGLEAIDFDDRETYDGILRAANDAGLTDAIARIEAGYCDDTPAGGVRWLWYCEKPDGNLKLARRPKRPDEQTDEHDRVKTLCETRGVGGFAILAPSNGRTHPSGRPYVRRSGGFTTIARVSMDERDAILDLCRSFDQMPKREPDVAREPKAANGTRPGDDFNRRATWADVLEPHGWRRGIRRGDVQHWVRPGKTFGTSATTNIGGSDLLFVFSSSTEFEPERGYSKFAAHAQLNHRGDFAAAARELASKGYGEQTRTDTSGTDAERTHVRDAAAEREHPAYQLRLAEELDRERARREARRILDAEERGPVQIPEILTLRDRLAQPRIRTEWRIDGWWPKGARLLLAAQFKAGKTTFVGNIVRSLVDADPFLGRASVSPVFDGSVVLIDTEMSATQLDDWLEAQGIEQLQHVVPILLRGHVASFNLFDPDVRAGWIATLKRWRTEVLILDCLRPVLDALGLDEHRDAGRFLVALDALLIEAGISECLVVQHMGHLYERARGDSRLRDWPDVELRLVRQDDNPVSARFISAYGRDVDVPESALAFDRNTRHLTITGGTRVDARTTAMVQVIADLLRRSSEPLGVRAIQSALVENGHPRDQIREGIKRGVESRVFICFDGPHGAKLHRLCERAAPCGDRAAHSERECAAAYIEPHTRTLNGEDSSLPFSRTVKPIRPFNPDDAFGERHEGEK